MLQDFKDYVKAAQGVETKMILDTAFLTDEEIATSCKLIAEAGIDWRNPPPASMKARLWSRC